MNRIIIVFLVVMTVGARPSFGDQKVEIHPIYLPDSSYSIKQSSVNQMTITLDNPFAAPENIRQNFPVAMVVDDNREISIVTGTVTDEKEFPITIEVKKAIQLLKQNDLVKSIDGGIGKLVGVRAHGTSDLQGNFKLTSLDGKELPDEARKILLATFDAVSKGMKSAQSEPIGIGEKFTKTVPLEIPVPGVMNIGMVMTLTYELLDVKDGIAEFITTYTFTLAASATSDQAIKIDASGKGAGKITYDVKKRVQLKSLDSLEIGMTLPLDSATIHVTTKTEDSVVTEVH
jgi:hypothetical protein